MGGKDLRFYEYNSRFICLATALLQILKNTETLSVHTYFHLLKQIFWVLYYQCTMCHHEDIAKSPIWLRLYQMNIATYLGKVTEVYFKICIRKKKLFNA